MSANVTPDLRNDYIHLPNGENRTNLLLHLEYKNVPDKIFDETIRFVKDNDDNQFNTANLDRLIKHYPHVIAGLVWQSAYYYNMRNAAEVALAFLRNDHTAYEWHFHISNVGKISLKEANDDVVINSIHNMIHFTQQSIRKELYELSLQNIIENKLNRNI